MTRATVAGPAILVLLVVVFFAPSLFGDRAELPCNPNRWDPWRAAASPEEIAPPAVNTDCALAYYPRRAFATARMRAGDLPLWDPYTFCGQPFLANYQSALLYPVNLALYFMEPLRAMGWFVAVHFALGGLFMIVLLRTLGLSHAAAAVGGIAYGLSPWFMTRIGHPTFVSTAAWIPLALALVFRLSERTTLRNAALLAGAFALAALAGFPQTLVHLHYAAALAALVLAARGAGSGRADGSGRAEGPGGSKGSGRFRFVLCYGGAALFSFALASFQLLPTYEFLRESTRDANDWATFLSGTHHPAMIWRSLFPDLFGNPMDGNLWSVLFETGNGYFRQNYVSTVGYCGLATLALGLPGLLLAPRRVFWIALFALSLAVLWGTPVARVFHALPGFALSRPDRIVVLVNLALAVGLASAIDGWNRARVLRIAARAIFASITVVSIVFLAAGSSVVAALSDGRVPFDVAEPTHVRTVVTTLVLGVAGLALTFVSRSAAVRAIAIGLLVAVDLLLFGSRFHLTLPRESTFRETDAIRAMRVEIDGGRILRVGAASADLLPPGTASLYAIRDLAGINALNLARYRAVLEAVQPGVYERRRYTPFPSEHAESPVLAMLGGVPYTVEEGLPVPLRVGAGPGRSSEDAPTRVRLVYDWETLPPGDALARLADPAFDPGAIVFLETATGSPKSPDRRSGRADAAGDLPAPPLGPGRGRADITHDEPDRVVIEAATDSAAVLFLADTHYPGWEVTVDGARAPLLRANHAFRAVALPAGQHVVEFTFRPRSFRIGAVVAAASWALFAGLVFVRRRRSA